MIEGYGAWRAWYRSHVPIVPNVATAEPERISS
jgi:hypothetical protein